MHIIRALHCVSLTAPPSRDHVFLMRPFRRHLFRCRSFSAQIVSAPIWSSLTVQLFKVRVRGRVWVRVSQKAPTIGDEKVRVKMVAPKSRGPHKAPFWRFCLHVCLAVPPLQVYRRLLGPSGK